ncbi:MAG: hypothetical protein H6699_09380 [Myxococcales bacterium]|nr:hypothetical protein [Myxococcales bacterium]
MSASQLSDVADVGGVTDGGGGADDFERDGTDDSVAVGDVESDADESDADAAAETGDDVQVPDVLTDAIQVSDSDDPGSVPGDGGELDVSVPDAEVASDTDLEHDLTEPLDVASDSLDVEWNPGCVPEPPQVSPSGTLPHLLAHVTAEGGQEICGPGYRVEVPASALRAAPSAYVFDAGLVMADHSGSQHRMWTSVVVLAYGGPYGTAWPIERGSSIRFTFVPFEAVEDATDVRALVTRWPGRGVSTSHELDVQWLDEGGVVEVPGDLLQFPDGGGVMVFLGSPPTSRCGNHILEDGEQCDGGVGCSYCHFDEPTCRPDTGCPPMDCFSEVLGGPQIDCSPTPVGPCEVSRCDSRSLECVAWPTFEGEPCVDGTTHGWCRGGVCDPTPEECALCERGYRWIDGGCEPEEQGATFVAGRAYSSAWAGTERDIPAPGGSHWGYYTYNGEPYVGFFGDLGPILSATMYGDIFLDPIVETGEVLGGVPLGHTLEYWARPWSQPVFSQYYPLEIPVPWNETFGTRVIGSSTSVDDAGRIEIWNDDADPAVGGSMLVTRVRIAEHDLGVCEVAVNVDGEWQTCPERPGATICAGQCVDTRQNLLHCGECGHACGDAEICTGGECVCDPRLARLDLPTCAWDACPDGWYGPGCRSACPGILEGEPECYGRGECSDGPFGTGICMCTGGHHGADCMYSCSDGVRNGSEVNVDCGGLRCAPCR